MCKEKPPEGGFKTLRLFIIVITEERPVVAD